MEEVRIIIVSEEELMTTCQKPRDVAVAEIPQGIAVCTRSVLRAAKIAKIINKPCPLPSGGQFLFTTHLSVEELKKKLR